MVSRFDMKRMMSISPEEEKFSEGQEFGTKQIILRLTSQLEYTGRLLQEKDEGLKDKDAILRAKELNLRKGFAQAFSLT